MNNSFNFQKISDIFIFIEDRVLSKIKKSFYFVSKKNDVN